MTRATTATLAAGIGLGAGLMYYLDPDRGSRRRTHLRNQMVHASHQVRDVAGKRGRDLGHRTAGVVARLRALARHDEGVHHRVLAERARAGATRVAAALAGVAGVAGVGLVARAAMNAGNTQQIELRS
jgi:hypothetical protein